MKIVGHRGASHLALDNTLESIQIALDCGVDYVEIDLQPTKDQKFLVFHDPYIKAADGKKISIKNSTAKELRVLFRQHLGREALLFDEVVDYMQKHSPQTGLVLDCKKTIWASSLIEHFEKFEPRGIDRDNFIVISFSFVGLWLFRRRENSVKTFYLRRRWIPLIHLFLSKLGGFSGAGYYIANNRFVLPLKIIKKFRHELFFYNINNVDFAKKCQQLDIEYIETDEPNVIVPAIRGS